MDQKFKLVGPRARLTEYDGFQIGDILFGRLWDRGIGLSDTAEHLVDLLAVPVVRKGDRKQASVEPQNTSQNYYSHDQDQHSDVLVTRAIKREASVKISKSHLVKKADHGG